MRTTEVMQSSPRNQDVAGESIHVKGRIRSSFVLDAFPCQPQLGFVQARSSFPNIFMASTSDNDDSRISSER